MPLRRRPIVYLVSTAGHPNLGDERITQGWLRFYATFLPEADVWLDCPRPGLASALFADTHPRLRCTDTLFRMSWGSPDAESEAIAKHGADVVEQPDRIPALVLPFETLSASDHFHLLGGGYVNDVWPQHYSIIEAIATLRRRGSAQAIATGLALTPLSPESQATVSSSLSSFDLVDARDPETERLLVDAGISTGLTGDDVLINMPPRRSVQLKDPTTAVMVQSDLLPYAEDELYDFVERTIRHWGAEDERVLVVEGIPREDAGVYAFLKERLPWVDILPFARAWREGIPSGSGVRWISSRLYPHVHGGLAGTPGVAVATTEPASASGHAALKELGSTWEVIHDLGTAPDLPEGDTSSFAELVQRLLLRKRRMAEQIPPTITGTRINRLGQLGKVLDKTR